MVMPPTIFDRVDELERWRVEEADVAIDDYYAFRALVVQGFDDLEHGRAHDLTGGPSLLLQERFTAEQVAAVDFIAGARAAER